MNKQRIWFSLFIAMLVMALLIPASAFATGGPDPAPGEDVVITFVGPVNSKSDSIPGPWVIAGRTVQVTRQTAFNVDPSEIQVGDVVEVNARVGHQGALTALAINKVQVRQTVHFSGVIQEITDAYGMVGDRKVTIVEETVIVGDEPDVGDMADVVAQETDDGLVARRIVVVDADQTVHFPGVIKEMHDDAWLIATPAGDKRVLITEDTVIEGDDPDVGDGVNVWAQATSEGLVATRIHVTDRPSQVHFMGRIQEIADDYWVVARQKVLLTPDTEIQGPEPQVGDLAEVWGEPTADGVVASRIRVISRHRFTVIRGVVEAQSETEWVIDGRTVHVNEKTRITGDPQVGDQVVAVVQAEEDGSFTARSIHKIPQSPPQDRVTFSGFVTEIEEGSPTKWVVTRTATPNREAATWVVWVSESTQIWPKDAEVEVGSWVKGFGEPNEDESVNALAVRVVDAPRAAFAGEIQQQPASGVIGDWVIDGVTVHVTDATRVIGAPEDWGGYAQGYGVLNPDSSIDAIVIGPMPH